MQVSLEIVPRSESSLQAAAATAAAFPLLGAINVPDLLRFPIRSWEACTVLAAGGQASDPPMKSTPPQKAAGYVGSARDGLDAGFVPRFASFESGSMPSAASERSKLRGTNPACESNRFDLIPHLRSIDFDPDRPFPYAEILRRAGVKRVLAVAGDPPQDMKRRIYPTSTLDFIRKLKTELPEIEIYAAFDPYRSNIRYELDYLRAKEDAGADGFMSQPFFDLRLLEIYAEYLEGRKAFWGLSPVVSESSRNYWEARNRAVFPRAFRPTLDWNIDFGRRVLDFCQRDGFDLYLMPIKVELDAYLAGLFA
jgi:methylenetetrahydrofolate reductase (NADPH)